MNPSKITQQITFLHSNNLEATRYFYTQLVGLELVRDQGACLIFKAAGNAFLGFCEHIEAISPGRKVILTLVTEDVDEWYQTLKKKGAHLVDPPKQNPQFQIYHFFLIDPDGYWVEIQRFEKPL